MISCSPLASVLTLLEPLSLASSVDAWEDEIPPVHTQSSDASVTSTPDAHAEQNIGTVESPRGRSIFKRWLKRKNSKAPTSPKSGRLSRRSPEPADPQSHSRSPARVNVTNEGPSWMAAGRPKTVSAVDRRSDVACQHIIPANGRKITWKTQGLLWLEFRSGDSSHVAEEIICQGPCPQTSEQRYFP